MPDTVPVEGVLEAQDQVSFQTVCKNHKTNNLMFDRYKIYSKKLTQRTKWILRSTIKQDISLQPIAKQLPVLIPPSFLEVY